MKTRQATNPVATLQHSCYYSVNIDVIHLCTTISNEKNCHRTKIIVPSTEIVFFFIPITIVLVLVYMKCLFSRYARASCATLFIIFALFICNRLFRELIGYGNIHQITKIFFSIPLEN